jgi:Predicted metal-dependent hydrolase of the TIM-barrel fold
MFANRVAMGRGLTSPRFRWVSFVDALMLPLNNDAAKRSNKDYAVFYPGEERLLKRYLADVGVVGRPATLDEYIARVVNPTLERHKRDGAVAVKFEIAYLRTLDFDIASHDDAARIYSRYVSGSEPPAAEYKLLQDYLFHEIAARAGSLGLPIHIHVADGAGPYYRQDGSNPLLLTTVLNDASLRQTNFVILHGGYPMTAQAASLLSKPNVYADFSFAGLDLYPRPLSHILRSWIEEYPQKILFGTDATPLSGNIAWEETGWMAVTTARKALAMALAGMVADGEISRARANELATMVLRGNAIKLYGLTN